METSQVCNATNSQTEKRAKGNPLHHGDPVAGRENKGNRESAGFNIQTSDVGKVKGERMNRKRILCLILTSPIWILIGVIACFVMIPLWIALILTSMIEYAFTGDFNLPWQ